MICIHCCFNVYYLINLQNTCFAIFLVQTPCDSSSCKHGGTCIAFSNSTFKCDCAAFFSGIRCDHQIGMQDIDFILPYT